VILSGLEIQKRLGSDIIIDPYNPDQLNPNSYNLRLHQDLLVYDEPVLDMKKAQCRFPPDHSGGRAITGIQPPIPGQNC
jgi:deoxycytidine triphosphate deaminase